MFVEHVGQRAEDPRLLREDEVVLGHEEAVQVGGGEGAGAGQLRHDLQPEPGVRPLRRGGGRRHPVHHVPPHPAGLPVPVLEVSTTFRENVHNT